MPTIYLTLTRAVMKFPANRFALPAVNLPRLVRTAAPLLATVLAAVAFAPGRAGAQTAYVANYSPGNSVGTYDATTGHGS